MSKKLHHMLYHCLQTDILPVEVMCNLIYRILQLCSYVFISFVDVFINVFNCLNRHINLYINVHIVDLNQIRAVGDHSSIVHNDFTSVYLLNSGTSIIAVLIQRVTVFYNNSFKVEGFQKVF